MSEPPQGTADLRVVVLNQYYIPDVASTGYLLSELANYLAGRGARVSVIASRPSYGPRSTWQDCPAHEVLGGVEVTRMRTTRFRKDHLLGRTCNSLTFLVGLTLRVLGRRRGPEVFLYTTNPPYLGVVGGLISLLRRHRYVLLLHDSYPQLAVHVGAIRAGGLIEWLWHRCNRFMYRRADQTIVLCREAKRLVCETYGIEEHRVHIVHNWADAGKLKSAPKAESAFARTHGLVEPFTVLYSGNLGLYYEFDTILGAAEQLRGEAFRLVFIGAGGKRDWIAQQVKQRDLRNTIMLPYQPFERLPDSLTACDASLVTIQRGVEGISYPSKLYASLAIGRPILALSEPNSELREIVQEHDVGLWFELGDIEGLTEGIRDMMGDPDRCAAQGRRARELFERSFTLEASAAKYAEVLQLAASQGNRGEP